MQAKVFSGVSLNSFAIFGINLATSSSFVNSLKSTKILPFLSISSYKILRNKNNNCFVRASNIHFAKADVYMVKINTINFVSKHVSNAYINLLFMPLNPCGINNPIILV